MSADGEIELLDTVDASGESVAETVASDRPLSRWLVVGAVFALCGWLVTSTGVDDADGQAEPEASSAEADEALEFQEPRELQAPLIESDRAAAVAIQRPGSDLWPDPRERDPNVTRTVGPALPPAEFSTVSLRSTSLVYVSASGMPTVVSLDTGDVLNVGVAAIRVHDTFAVEAGQVVSAEAAADPASAAVVFHSYRDVDGPGPGRSGNRVGVGPELCLSGETCAAPGSGVDRRHRNGVVVERFDPLRHGELDAILTSWFGVDGELESPDGYRMPEPVGVIWVISPASGGSVSSSGLL